MKEGVEATLTSIDNDLKIQPNSGEITQNKQLNKSKRQSSKTCTHRKTRFNTTCPHLHNRIQKVVDRVTLSNQLVGRTQQRKTRQQSKPKDIQTANIKDSLRPASSGDQVDDITGSHRSPTIEVHTINPGGQKKAN